MNNERKAFRWDSVIRADLKVEVTPAFGRKGALENLSIQSNKTYRSDIDGVHYVIRSDNAFDVKIFCKGKLLMLSKGKEVIKYWCSTVEEAKEYAKWLISKSNPVYYIYKTAENYYSIYGGELKSSEDQLVATVAWQPEHEGVNYDAVN